MKLGSFRLWFQSLPPPTHIPLFNVQANILNWYYFGAKMQAQSLCNLMGVFICSRFNLLSTNCMSHYKASLHLTNCICSSIERAFMRSVVVSLYVYALLQCAKIHVCYKLNFFKIVISNTHFNMSNVLFTYPFHSSWVYTLYAS